MNPLPNLIVRFMLPTCLLWMLLPSNCQQAFSGEQDQQFEIYWIDVEGGAATLMVTPAGESVLVDSGNPGVRDPNRIVRVATRMAGLTKIDHLITTHYHRDHFGGAALLSQLMPIGTVYDNGVFEGMPNDPGPEYFGFQCDRRIVIQPGDTLPLQQVTGGPQITMECLGTRQTFMQADARHASNDEICADCQTKDRDGSDNANSVVMLVTFGEFRFFDAGDLTWNQEANLVCPRNLVGPVDVYQVTHHGLDASNNPVVLHTIQPTVAIMNNGHQKGCLPEVFANLKSTESLQAIFQVHKNLRPDGSVNNAPDAFIANHEPAETCQGHHIQMKVTADSLRFEVAIPARGFSQTFATRPK
ncbi:MAG: MBL fold metallo-hydrolase [bacterium]|nr:MBL fold metallo-hydrolase [bacterium]